jgi:hypothetical protein
MLREQGLPWTRWFMRFESARVRSQQQFPSRSLEQVYGAIAFYLGRRAEVDANIREGEEQIRRQFPSLTPSKPEAYQRLQRA